MEPNFLSTTSGRIPSQTAPLAEWKTSSNPSAVARVLIAVCTLNEAENIDRMVRELRRVLPEADVLVVDDHSPDGTAQIVRALAEDDTNIRVDVRTERGLGGAIRHAIESAINGKYDWFINLDGDFSHDPHRLPEMLSLAMEGDNVDVVIGSRYINGGTIQGWPMRRRVMSRLVNGFATRILGLPISDCSGSMRCYRTSKLAEVEIEKLESEGYSILEEILIKLHRHGAQMVEVPICFSDRALGKSKLSTKEAVRSMWKIMGLAWKV